MKAPFCNFCFLPDFQIDLLQWSRTFTCLCFLYLSLPLLCNNMFWSSISMWFNNRMVVRFTTTCAISAYHHYHCCEFEARSWRGFLHQLNWLPRYNWNIVESGIKYQSRSNVNIYNVDYNTNLVGGPIITEVKARHSKHGAKAVNNSEHSWVESFCTVLWLNI
jgi:hypothetical protein